MMISEQMDVAILNSIHFALSKDGGLSASPAKLDPLMDYVEFLLFRLNPKNFEETKKCFQRLPLGHLEESLPRKMLEMLPQLSIDQVF